MIWGVLKQLGRKHHQPPLFSSQRSWRKAWPWRRLAPWGECPCRGPWRSPRGMKKEIFTALVTSITAALPSLRGAFLVCSDTRDHRVSMLTVGVYCWFLCSLNFLIPRLPKYPGWLNRSAREVLLFVHVDSHVVHATGQTTTSRMLSVLSDSTVTVWHVSSQLSRLSESGNLSPYLIREGRVPFLSTMI